MSPDDLWTWRVKLHGGSWMTEDGVGSIGNVPAALVDELHLVHRSEQGRVAINLQSGNANINGRIVEPLISELGDLPKTPLFFRRRSMKKALSANPEISTLFRAVGFVVFRGGEPLHIAAIRVFDEAIDRTWYTTWPADTARHVANMGVMIGG